MTVSQTGVVDWLTITKEQDCVTLTVVDDLEWSEELAHIFSLQEKLNTYLAFIESGEIFDHLRGTLGHENLRNAQIKVAIVARLPLTAKAGEFLEFATTQFRGAGCELSHTVLTLPEGASRDSGNPL